MARVSELESQNALHISEKKNLQAHVKQITEEMIQMKAQMKVNQTQVGELGEYLQREKELGLVNTSMIDGQKSIIKVCLDGYSILIFLEAPVYEPICFVIPIGLLFAFGLILV